MEERGSACQEELGGWKWFRSGPAAERRGLPVGALQQGGRGEADISIIVHEHWI